MLIDAFANCASCLRYENLEVLATLVIKLERGEGKKKRMFSNWLFLFIFILLICIKEGENRIYYFYKKKKKDINMHGIKWSFTKTHKSFPMPISGENEVLKFVVTCLYFTKYNEIKYFIQLHKSTFHTQDHTEGLWYIMGYTCKQLDMYFKLHFIVCLNHTKF